MGDVILVRFGWVARNRALLKINTCLLLCTINIRCTTVIIKCVMLNMITNNLRLWAVNNTTIHTADPTQCAS